MAAAPVASDKKDESASPIGLAAFEPLPSLPGVTLPSGHYDPRVGEILDSRYEIARLAGSGASGRVYFASDLKDYGRQVAVKIFKKDHSAYAAQEFQVGSVFKAEPLISRVHGCFSLADNTHACVVLEPLFRDLDRVKHALPLPVIRTIARDLFGALARIHGAGYMHCDVKPANIMFASESSWNVKLIDFSISHRVGAMLSDYTQTRFWRSPDVHLGLALTPAIDVWSAACVLVELFTNKLLFGGHTTTDHFLNIVSTLGTPPLTLLQNGRLSRHYFDCTLESLFGKTVTHWALKKSLSHRVGTVVSIAEHLTPFGASTQEKRDFVDLIERILVYDPASRLTAEQALGHPFLRDDDSKTRNKLASSSSGAPAAVSTATATSAPAPVAPTQPVAAPAPTASAAPAATKPAV